MLNTASLRDAFCNEIVKLSPPNLASINFTGSSNLRSFVVSPMTSCPSLSAIDLSECNSLEYVMVQSQSAQTLQIKGCQNLSKVRAPNYTFFKYVYTGKVYFLTLLTAAFRCSYTAHT